MNKVICIDNNISYYIGIRLCPKLTLYKEYDLIYFDDSIWCIEDDNGLLRYVHKDHFISLKEYQDRIFNQKVEELLNG